MRNVCSSRSAGRECRYFRSASIAAVHGPWPKRTCFIGKGRTFHDTFSRLFTLPSFGTAFSTGSWANKILGTRAEPATAVAVPMKFLRDNFRNEVMLALLQTRFGSCVDIVYTTLVAMLKANSRLASRKVQTPDGI